VAMSARRRAALLVFSRAKEVCIVEDDYDSEFRYDGRPLDALQTLDRDGLVFYVGTFSKSLFPALRIGFIIMPQWASPALTRAKKLTDWHAPIHVQETLASFIREGHFDRHARKMRRIYAERRATLLEALEMHCVDVLSPMPSTAGLHIGVRYQSKRALESYLPTASQRGLALQTFARYSSTGLKDNGLALGYSSIATFNIHEGIEMLHGILTAKRP
jgi:GntR family transcriptional regulator / MocR family aminotransferase